MKKTTFALLLAMTSLTATAQEEGQQNDYLPDGMFTLEWRFNPFDYESKPTNMSQLNGRLFLDEKNAVRVSVGFGYNTDKDEEKKDLDTRLTDGNNYDVENTTTAIKNNETSLKLAIGYEYHFASTGRLDFYGGLEGGYIGRFYSATKESSTTKTNVATVSGTSTKTQSQQQQSYEYDKSNADRTKFNENGFFATLFTGIDFYVYKKLYIGAELGLTFNSGKKANGTYTMTESMLSYVGANETANWNKSFSSENGATVYVDNMNKKNNKTTYDYAVDNSGTYSKLYIEPAIRIGWIF